MSDRINHEPVFLLSAVPWRESSLWLEVFSRRYGRVALLARSARKRQSELRGIIVPFVPFSASWYGGNELKTLHRAEWLGGWPQPQGRALFSGLYLNELLLKLTAREDPHPALYDSLNDTLRTVCTQDKHTAALRLFEWRLLNEAGIAPDINIDAHGRPIEAGQQYCFQTEHPLLPQAEAPAGSGITVSGNALQQLAAGCFDDSDTLQQARRITRLLLDHHLPGGIASRHILQQLHTFSDGLKPPQN